MDLESGVQIGDFRIEKRIGNGATGIVYRARQVPLDRVVALKVLGSSLVDGREIARLQREARAVARLDHPGIAAVYYIGQDQHTCYMAMEYVEGISLDRLIAVMAALDDPDSTIDSVLGQMPQEQKPAAAIRFDGPDDYRDGDFEVGDAKSTLGTRSDAALRVIVSRRYIRRSCEMICDAADALAHAHDQGVVHRDLKPANLIIDPEGRAHLIDFGIARIFDDTTVTKTGALVGTPMYLAPELLTGRIAADHLSDIYSLGLVLYELLTLQRPIEATTREAILREVLTKQLKPVSWLNPGVSRDLEGVVHKASSKDPDDRYQSANDLAQDLKRYIAGKKVEARPYRYRLDEREIAAERPPEILAVVFTCQFFAILLIVVGGFVIARHPEALAIGTALFNLFVASCLASAGWFYVLGHGLLAGRWIAWGAALVTCVIGFLASVFYSSFLTGALALYVTMSPSITALFTLLLNAPAMVVAGILIRRRSRNWFRFAEELRAEHSKHLARFSLWPPRSWAKVKRLPVWRSNNAGRKLRQEAAEL
jgi:serine/threonine protein kinase